MRERTIWVNTTTPKWEKQTISNFTLKMEKNKVKLDLIQKKFFTTFSKNYFCFLFLILSQKFSTFHVIVLPKNENLKITKKCFSVMIEKYGVRGLRDCGESFLENSIKNFQLSRLGNEFERCLWKIRLKRSVLFQIQSLLRFKAF